MGPGGPEVALVEWGRRQGAALAHEVSPVRHGQGAQSTAPGCGLSLCGPRAPRHDLLGTPLHGVHWEAGGGTAKAGRVAVRVPAGGPAVRRLHAHRARVHAEWV